MTLIWCPRPQFTAIYKTAISSFLTWTWGPSPSIVKEFINWIVLMLWFRLKVICLCQDIKYSGPHMFLDQTTPRDWRNGDMPFSEKVVSGMLRQFIEHAELVLPELSSALLSDVSRATKSWAELVAWLEKSWQLRAPMAQPSCGSNQLSRSLLPD